MSRYVIYCRKSSESEERQVLSIESQIKELDELAKRLNLPIAEVLTESRSAKYPGRPIFNQLMEQVSKREITGIVSWKLDRLARNPIDGAALIWAVDQGNLQEIITPTSNHRNNSSDKFLMQIEFGIAKKYVDDLSDNVRRGIRMKLDKGWLPGLAPLGYLNEPRERTIVPDPDRFGIVRTMWNMLLQGKPPFQIHRMAAESYGLRTPSRRQRGGKPLCLASVYRIFTNPFYYGVIRRNSVDFQGKHEPMITEGEFWKAQEILGQKGLPRPKTYQFPFTGLIRCGECGGAITAESKVNRYGSHYVYYHCTKKNRTVKCGQRSVRGEELEYQIVRILESIRVPKKILDIALHHIEQEEAEEQQTKFARIESLKSAQGECVRKLGTLNQMRLRELIDDQEYLKEKQKLLNEKIKLDQNLGPTSEHSNPWERTKEVFAIANQIIERFEKGTPQEKRALLKGIGSNFFLMDKKLSVQIEKPFVLIQNSLMGSTVEKERIEPQNGCMVTDEIHPTHPQFLIWCTLVDDVRTFYEEKVRK